MGRLFTVTGASIHLGVAPSTIKNLEARGVIQKFMRDSAGRRLITDADIAAIEAYFARTRAPSSPVAA